MNYQYTNLDKPIADKNGVYPRNYKGQIWETDKTNSKTGKRYSVMAMKIYEKWDIGGAIKKVFADDCFLVFDLKGLEVDRKEKKR